MTNLPLSDEAAIVHVQDLNHDSIDTGAELGPITELTDSRNIIMHGTVATCINSAKLRVLPVGAAALKEEWPIGLKQTSLETFGREKSLKDVIPLLIPILRFTLRWNTEPCITVVASLLEFIHVIRNSLPHDSWKLVSLSPGSDPVTTTSIHKKFYIQL
eukprot:gb/GECG01000393.1/.p1 GENE.gb/GECG01000393.1/~~gb/GECG01000393.1/.p1  ORF type:complete len:159 (+),score=9.17 gb/GECG01000393.1/:1-477(+)